MSTDPVMPHAGDPRYFGRYHYGANSPYAFTDPSGESFTAGARVGGSLGSLVSPGFGTAVGALVGGAVGHFAGHALADRLGATPELDENGMLSVSSDGDDQDDPNGEASSSGGPPTPDPDDQESLLAKSAKRMTLRELERAARNNGYEDAHDLKADLGLDSKRDIFSDKYGNMYEGPRKGPGPLHELGLNKDGS